MRTQEDNLPPEEDEIITESAQLQSIITVYYSRAPLCLRRGKKKNMKIQLLFPRGRHFSTKNLYICLLLLLIAAAHPHPSSPSSSQAGCARRCIKLFLDGGFSGEVGRGGAVEKLPQPSITDVLLLLRRFGFSCSRVWNRKISMWFTRRTTSSACCTIPQSYPTTISFAVLSFPLFISPSSISFSLLSSMPHLLRIPSSFHPPIISPYVAFLSYPFHLLPLLFSFFPCSFFFFPPWSYFQWSLHMGLWRGVKWAITWCASKSWA